MAEFDVSLTGGLIIDFGATGTGEVLQNVANILSSVVFSCPMNRDFALNADLLDKPMNVAQALLTSRIIAAVKKYEPRAEITKVSYDGSGPDGLLKPTVRVKVNG